MWGLHWALYALTAGAGCSHGLIGATNGIYKVDPANMTWTLIADLSAFQKAHPVAHPNHGELDAVSPNGTIRRVADISATQGHIAPTAVAYHGNFYVGNLHTFPIVDGSSKVLKITPSGQVKTWVTGLTTVLGVAFDSRNRMYILENTTGAGNMFPTPNTGVVLRVTATGLETIATGLSLPTAMTFGPDGALYVSNFGFGPPMGEIVRITVP